MAQKRARLGTAVAVSYAAVGGLLSATGAIVSLWLSDMRGPCEGLVPPLHRETCALDAPGGLAPVVVDAYERGWVVMVLILLAVPMLALAFRLTQVRLTRVRAGQLAGNQSLQGREVRGDRAGTVRVVLIGVLAAPLGYGLLWLWLSGSAAEGTRFLPESVWPGLVVWPGVAVFLGVLAVAAVLRPPERSPERDPWGWRRRRRPRTTGMVRLGLRFVLTFGALGAVIYMMKNVGYHPVLLWFIELAWIGLVWTFGEPVLAVTGQFLAWSNPRKAGAGRRLVALAPRATGAAGILLVLGIALSVQGRGQVLSLAETLWDGSPVDWFGLPTVLLAVSLLAVLPSLLLLGLVVAQEVADRKARRKQMRLVLHSTLLAGYLIGLFVPGQDGWDWAPVALAASVVLPVAVELVALVVIPLLARMPAPELVGDVPSGMDEVAVGEGTRNEGATGGRVRAGEVLDGELPGGKTLDWYLNG